MTAYIDSSWLISIAFSEQGHDRLSRRLREIGVLTTAALTEAEVRAAFSREQRPYRKNAMQGISVVLPDVPLTSELEQVFAVGHLRGADAWHLANALYLADDDPGSITFLTLDARQRKVAMALGFAV